MKRTIEERKKILEDFIREKPTDYEAWVKEKGLYKTSLYAFVDKYRIKNKIAGRTVIDMLRLELLPIDEVAKTWRDIKPQTKKASLESRVAGLEKQLAALTKHFNL